MVDDGVQRQLEDLAQELGRAATIEDLDGRGIAYSAHRMPVDAVRVRAILSRETPPDVYEWQQSHGVAGADGPVRIPPNPDLGMAARLCVPLRHRGRRLGHLWIIEGDDPCTPAEVDAAARRAVALAALLDAERSPARAELNAAARLLRRALGADRRGRADALRRLRDEHGMPDEGTLRMLVLVPLPDGGAEAEAPVAEALDGIVAWLGDRFLTRRRERLAAAVSGHVAVLLADPPGRDAEAAGAGGRRAVARLREDAVAALAPGTALMAGLGDPRSRLADVPAAHAEACRAARAAAVDPALAPLAAWEEIGVHRLLPADPGEAELATAATLLDRLRAGRDGAALAQTLETYLDLAAGAQATAAALHLHRTSLYHRLGRIEQLTGRDLRDGRDRLELHLALKLARAARAPAL